MNNTDYTLTHAPREEVEGKNTINGFILNTKLKEKQLYYVFTDKSVNKNCYGNVLSDQLHKQSTQTVKVYEQY